MIKPAERKSNFDLMRILCILLIIMFHYTMHGGFLYLDYAPQKYFYGVTGIWGLLGVLGFITVSSHFLYSRGSFSVQKILRIIFEASFYPTLITIVLYLAGLIDISNIYIFECIFSPFIRQYWFITDYIIFYLLTPFLKFFCDRISTEKQKMLLIVLFFVIFPLSDITHVNSFSKLGIFVYIYILIAYFIRKPDNFFQKHYKLLSVIVFGLTISLSCLLICLSHVTNDDKFITRILEMSELTSTLMFLSAVCLYFIFKNMNLGYSKILYFIGGSTLAVYLIHEHGYLHYILFDQLLKRYEVYNLAWGPLIFILSCAGVLLACSLIHNCISFIFRKTIYSLTDKYLKKRYEAFDSKYVPSQEKSSGSR